MKLSASLGWFRDVSAEAQGIKFKAPDSAVPGITKAASALSGGRMTVTGAVGSCPGSLAPCRHVGRHVSRHVIAS